MKLTPEGLYDTSRIAKSVEPAEIEPQAAERENSPIPGKAPVVELYFQIAVQLGVPELPEVPDEPLEPDVPDEPEVPLDPDEPDVPELPELPEVPDEPLEPDVPDEPEVPFSAIIKLNVSPVVGNPDD